jgi:hypothetical protein
MKTPPAPLPDEMRGQTWTVKDFARHMGICTRAVRRWWKVLRVKPDVCVRNGCHRWSEKAARRLLTKWRGTWTAKGWQASEAVRKFAGQVKRERDARQLRLKLKF